MVITCRIDNTSKLQVQEMKTKTKIKGPENLWNQHFSFIPYLAGCSTMGSTLLYRCILSMFPADAIPFPAGLDHQPLCGKMSPFPPLNSREFLRELDSRAAPNFPACPSMVQRTYSDVIHYFYTLTGLNKKTPSSDPWWVGRRTLAITFFSGLIWISKRKVSF